LAIEKSRDCLVLQKHRLKAGVLQGDAFAVSTVVWTGAQGAAALLNTAHNFPFGDRRFTPKRVVATRRSGAQNQVIERVNRVRVS
jgi:hypothetical protein